MFAYFSDSCFEVRGRREILWAESWGTRLYTAYPGVTAKEIKAMAMAADVSAGGEQRPFLVILPIKSRLAFVEVQLLLKVRD